jgi:hypothetical protein
MNQLIDGMLLAQAANDWWTDQFFGLDQEKRFVILILAIVFGTTIVISIAGIIGGTLSGMHRRRLEADMKQDMLDRGMTAEEVAQVVESTPPESFLDRWAAGQGKRKTG